MKKLMLMGSLVAIFFGTTAFVKVKEANNLKAFAKFLSHFEKVEMPFEVDLGDFEQYKEMQVQREKDKQERAKYKKDLPTFREFIPELRGGKMSRLGPPEIVPVARYYPSEEIVAVIYSSFHPFRDGHIYFSLKHFDLKGRSVKMDKVNKKNYAYSSFYLGFASLTNKQTFSIGKDGLITKQEYIALWEKDAEKYGFENNEIIGYELENTSHAQVLASGYIKELKGVESLAGSTP